MVKEPTKILDHLQGSVRSVSLTRRFEQEGVLHVYINCTEENQVDYKSPSHPNRQ